MNRFRIRRVSSSLSKIPYSGFSPVRLQTGIQPRPSSNMLSLSASYETPAFPGSPTSMSACFCDSRWAAGSTQHKPSSEVEKFSSTAESGR
jgi:hypothetical protein